ncbi:MAG: hypothetical protein ACXAEU_05960 [Candidatus Hodarchaeales archaeon]
MTNRNIIQDVLNGLSEKGCQGRFVSINHIENLRNGIEEPYKQELIDKGLYNTYLSGFIFDPREQLDDANSIVVVAYPQPQIRVFLNWEGRHFSSTLPPTYPEK